MLSYLPFQAECQLPDAGGFMARTSVMYQQSSLKVNHDNEYFNSTAGFQWNAGVEYFLKPGFSVGFNLGMVADQNINVYNYSFRTQSISRSLGSKTDLFTVFYFKNKSRFTPFLQPLMGITSSKGNITETQSDNAKQTGTFKKWSQYVQFNGGVQWQANKRLGLFASLNLIQYKRNQYASPSQLGSPEYNNIAVQAKVLSDLFNTSPTLGITLKL